MGCSPSKTSPSATLDSAILASDPFFDDEPRFCTYFDWDTCQFDEFLPSGLGRTMPEDEWASLIDIINQQVLGQFACKYRMRPAVKYLKVVRYTAGWAVPPPEKALLVVTRSGIEKVADHQRKSAYKEKALPVLQAYAAEVNATIQGIGRVEVTEVAFSPKELAELKAARRAAVALLTQQRIAQHKRLAVVSKKFEEASAEVRAAVAEKQAKVRQAVRGKMVEKRGEDRVAAIEAKRAIVVPCLNFFPVDMEEHERVCWDLFNQLSSLSLPTPPLPIASLSDPSTQYVNGVYTGGH